MRPTIVFFDMDHTLIDNDCDVSWKAFLVEEGLAEPEAQQTADRHFQAYVRGELNVRAFLQFQLAEFRNRTPAAMKRLAERHCRNVVQPKVYADARATVDDVRRRGIPVAVLTATNGIVAAPVAGLFGIETLIATRLAVKDGRFTGDIEGTYCHGEGKVACAQSFCEANGFEVGQAAYYGDSLSDVPMLAAVGEPHVVNPGDSLRALAHEYQWPISVFRR